MDQALALWSQFHTAHPIYATGASFMAGMLAPRLITLAEKSGIPWFVAKARARQDALLSKAGLSPADIAAVRAREAKDLRDAADQLEK